MARKSVKAKRLGYKVCFIVILAIVLGVSILFENQVNNALGLTVYERGEYEGNSIAQVVDVADSLKIHFVDVGQGDACIVELPDGKKMIIDGGKDKEKQKLLGYIDETIDPTDAMLGKKQSGGYGFDYAILTHADEDHCGGLDDVLLEYRAQVFYRPSEASSYKDFVDPLKNSLPSGYTSHNTLAYMRVISAGHENSEDVYINGFEGDVISPQGLDESDPSYYEIVFYTPLRATYKDRNDYSPIIIMYFQGRKIVLTGDAEKQAEADFVEAAQKKNGKFSVFTASFSVDIIKLGHHGSRTSSSKEFIETLTTPQSIQNVLFIISCGAGNSYGHPHAEVLQRLYDMGVSDEQILRTDTMSSIVLSVDNAAIMFGADVLISTRAALEIGTVSVQWREIAITIFVFFVIVLFIKPSYFKSYASGDTKSKSKGGSKSKSRGGTKRSSSGKGKKR